MNETEYGRIHILVLDRGYIIACRCQPPTDYALWIPVTHSRTIRVWGTTKGLAELLDGPIDNKTVLDAVVAKETIPVRAVIRVIEPESFSAKGYAAWTRALALNKRGKTNAATAT